MRTRTKRGAIEGLKAMRRRELIRRGKPIPSSLEPTQQPLLSGGNSFGMNCPAPFCQRKLFDNKGL